MALSEARPRVIAPTYVYAVCCAWFCVLIGILGTILGGYTLIPMCKPGLNTMLKEGLIPLERYISTQCLV